LNKLPAWLVYGLEVKRLDTSDLFEKYRWPVVVLVLDRPCHLIWQEDRVCMERGLGS